VLALLLLSVMPAGDHVLLRAAVVVFCCRRFAAPPRAAIFVGALKTQPHVCCFMP
jgi:hypothetical protein